MWGLRYLTAYAIGSCIGVLNEYIQKPEQSCYVRPDYSHILTCGACNVYGWSVLGLTAFFDGARAVKVPTALTILAIGPVLSLLELCTGMISKWYFGEQRWKYPETYCPIGDGYISLVSSAYFAVAGLLYWTCLYGPFVSKI